MTIGPAVVVITGIMAAGKSTVAQALAERLPHSAHVRGDVFRRMVVGGRADMTSPLSTEAVRQLELRYRLAAGAADGYAAAGLTAVLQDVAIGPALAQLLGMISTRPRYLVVLAPDVVAVREREAGRDKIGYGSFTVDELDRVLRTTTPPAGLWIDSSTLTVEQTVVAILEGLASADLDRQLDERQLDEGHLDNGRLDDGHPGIS